MFTLTLPNGGALNALNHLPLDKHTRTNCGYALPKVNYFTWAAYPHRSEGCILVSEASLLAAMAEDVLVPGATCGFTIADGTTTVEFQNVCISSIEAFNSTSTSSVDVAGIRLLCINFYLDRNIVDYNMKDCSTDSYYSSYHLSWSGLINTLYTATSSALVAPAKFNEYINYKNILLRDLFAFIANSQFLTAYPNKTNTGKADITAAVFNPATLNEDAILFNDTGTTLRKLKLQINYPTLEYKFGVMKFYYDLTTDLSEEYSIAPSNVLNKITNLVTSETVSFTNPFSLVNQATPAVSNAYILGFLDSVKQNFVNRFSSYINIVLRGVSSQSITNNIQKITYAYDARGFTTTLQSMPWELPKVELLDQSTNDIIFVATLLTDRALPICLANIYHPMNLVTIVDPVQIVYDPLNLVRAYKAGTSCYVARTYNGEYIIISGPCPTNSSGSSSSASGGRLGCCTYGSPGSPSQGIMTEAACTTLGGTWVGGVNCLGTSIE